jgi:hypothetical protein
VDDSGRALGLPDAPSVSWPLLSTGGGVQNLRVRVSDAKGGYASTQRSLIVGPNSLLFAGTVIDDTTNAPVANATVTLTGGSSPVTTDANGLFQISVPDAPRFVLNVNKTAYALTSWILYGRATNLRIPLHQAEAAPLNASTGGTTTFSKNRQGLTLSATFPANVLVDQNNNPYTGTATIEGFQYDISQPNPIPGDQGAIYSGKTVRLSTFGAFHITPRDTMGNPLQMASGGSVSVTMAVDPLVQSLAPATIPLWIYDQPSGMWQLHGTMTLSGTSYTGNITHFSEYNADTILNGGLSSCVKVILDPLSFTPGNVVLEAAYVNAGPDTFYHQDVTVDDTTPIGIERLAPNKDFKLTIKDATTNAVLKTVTLNSGPPLDQMMYPSGFTGDPNFTACNGPYTVYNSGIPTAPTYLMSVFGGSMKDNSAAYYQATGATPPGAAKSNLTAWKHANGFDTNPDDASAYYFNNGDLKLGRHMHCRNTGGGAVACYVSNYGQPGHDDYLGPLSAARNMPASYVATVCMEYNPTPTDGTNVQFFAYAANDLPFTVTPSSPVGGPTLDFQGAKPVPDMCLACHGGHYDPTTQLVKGGAFLPFDLDSFKYDPIGDPHTANQQQEQFRLLNAMILATANNGNQPLKDLMQMWYGNNASWNTTPMTLFQLGASTGVNLPNGDWTSTGQDTTALYDTVVSKVCRTCHIVHSFDPWNLFGGMNGDPSIKTYACGPNNPNTWQPPSFSMPHAEVPFKVFWNNSLNSTLATQLTGVFGVGGTCPNQ